MPQIDSRGQSNRKYTAVMALFFRKNSVRYSDFVKYSDVDQSAIENP